MIKVVMQAGPPQARACTLCNGRGRVGFKGAACTRPCGRAMSSCWGSTTAGCAWLMHSAGGTCTHPPILNEQAQNTAKHRAFQRLVGNSIASQKPHRAHSVMVPTHYYGCVAATASAAGPAATPAARCCAASVGLSPRHEHYQHQRGIKASIWRRRLWVVI